MGGPTHRGGKEHPTAKGARVFLPPHPPLKHKTESPPLSAQLYFYFILERNWDCFKRFKKKKMLPLFLELNQGRQDMGSCYLEARLSISQSNEGTPGSAGRPRQAGTALPGVLTSIPFRSMPGGRASQDHLLEAIAPCLWNAALCRLLGTESE